MRGAPQLRRPLRRVEQGTDAAFGSRERPQTFIVRERQRLHQNAPEILRRKGAIQIIVAEAGSGEAGGAAATPGRSEPCFACRISRFDFFETPIFLPNKISCKDNNRPRVCLGFFSAAHLVESFRPE